MKAFSVILAFYIVVLTAIPCVERPFEQTLHKTEFSKTAGDSHEHDAGHCSPFCVCNCCGNHIVKIDVIRLSNVFSCHGKQVFWYIPSIESNPIYSIWQPPKLS